MKALNLGILAHVDAGKTSLTERLLFQVGVLDKLGSVDAGSTHTDSLELEQRRGITIQSSVVSFYINQTKINLIDTPGHADFISEVERALSVIDAVVLVVSAVEGIQAQTRVLMNTLKRLKKPTLLFINKIDRPGAKTTTLINEIMNQLQVVTLPMVRLENTGTAQAHVTHLTIKDNDYYNTLMESLIEQDDTFLEKCVSNGLAIKKSDFLQQILSATSKTHFYPLYFGSAVTGVGVDELCIGIEHYLPCHETDPDAQCKGTLFKIEKTTAQQKMFYINLTAGKMEVRKTIDFYRKTEQGEHIFSEKIRDIKTFEQGKIDKVKTVSAGSIACITGLKSAKIGDTLSTQHGQESNVCFARPALETTVIAMHPEDKAKLFNQLKAYAEEDPLICLEKKKHSDAICIKLYGEVQQQIIKDRLSSECGIEVEFTNTKVICIERPSHTGEAVNIMDLHNAPLKYYATLGFRIEPGPIGAGNVYRMHDHSGRIPKGYHAVVEEAVFKFLETGLHGWQVTDAIITLTEAGVCPLSIAPHFRQLTPLLLQQALEQAQTHVCEPFSKIEIDLPTNMLNQVLVELATFHTNIVDGNNITAEIYNLQGEVLSKYLHGIQKVLSSLTQGRGILISHHAGYWPQH